MPQEMLFSGENRQRALEQLIDAYQTVAASAWPAAGPQQNPVPKQRVVLIHAERGLGKTRLAMELYRHLTTEHDPDHYWPDDYQRMADRVSVMPRAEDCTYTGRPHLLWWGIQIEDGPRPGNPVLNGLGDLLPHLTTVRLAARRRGGGIDLATELGNLAIDLGIEGRNIILEGITDASLSFLGPLKSIGTAIWKVGKVVHGQVKQKRDPLRHAEAHVESVVESVIDDLGRLFDPQSRDYAGIPLVILVDDAQFADRADAVDHFLERLIGRATRQNWPLLLLLTHWSRDLSEWTNAAGETQPRSKVARIIDHARHGDERDPRRFAGEGGDHLSQSSFLTIDLREPVDDLSPALHQRFPGLAAETVAKILGFVDGNPRKLEQIMARMDERPVWFQGRKRTNDLTPDGLSHVLSLSELRIDEIVYERFRDTPEDVRRALTLAGILGQQFLVDLVERLSEARFGTQAQSGLRAGEETYRLLRDVVDRSRDVPSAFAERLFQEAARAYRDTGMAGEELAGWPDDEDLDAALDLLMKELVANPERFDGLRPGELAHAYGLVADRLVAQGEPAARLALARLVSVENERANYEGASTAALRFADEFRLVAECSLEGIPDHLADEVARTLFQIGRREDAGSVWHSLLLSVESRAALDPDNAGWQRNLAVSHDRIGDVERAEGNRDAARRACQASLDICERLVALDPGNAGWQRNLAVSHSKIGDVEMAEGNRDAARRAYLASLDIRAHLAALDPGNAGWQRDLSISHDRIGDVEMAEGNRDAARRAYQASLDIDERLVALDPGNAGWQSDLAVSHGRIGDVEMAEGNRDAARRAYQASLDIDERLVALDPGNAGWQRNLAVSHNRIGDVEMAEGNRDAARRAYQASLDIHERLVALDPGNAGWQRNLAVSHSKIGDVEMAEGNRDAARRAYQASLDIHEHLAALDPGNAGWQRDLIVSHVNMAETGMTPAIHYAAALVIAHRLADTGRLAPADHWIIDDFSQRLAAAQPVRKG